MVRRGWAMRRGRPLGWGSPGGGSEAQRPDDGCDRMAGELRLTSRERLRRAYFHEEMDRPGVWIGTLYPPDAPTYDVLKSYLRRHADAKVGFNGTAFEQPYPTDEYAEPHSDDFERRVAVLHTPAGDLRCSRLESLRGQPGLHETFYIKGREDAEKYLSLPMPQIGGDVSEFFAKDKDIGDRGVAEARLGSNPAGWVAGLCGSETFALMSLSDRDVLHALCERHMHVVTNRVKFLLSKGIGPFFAIGGQELVCPPLHGPKDFHDFNVGYDKPIFDLVHEAGGRIYVHCHGSLKRVFEGFLAAGADVLHPFEAPPMGDITPAECKALARGRLCLEGNIQINRFYECTPEEIRDETLALIEAAFDDRRGLIVNSSASPYIRGQGGQSFPRFKAMIDTVVQWRP